MNDNEIPKYNMALRLFWTLIAIVFVVDIFTNFVSDIYHLPIIPVSITGSILTILLAYPALYVFIFRPLNNEISHHIKTEEELRKLSSIVSSTDDAIVSKTLDGTVVTWNQGAEKIYGYTKEEMEGKSITILFPDDRKDDLSKFIEKIQKGESINHYETQRKCKKGDLIDVSLTISPVRNVYGKVIGASTIARDITERKKAEELLRQAKEQAELLLKITPSALFTLDSRRRITSWNDAASKITGYAHDEVIGKPCNFIGDLPCNPDCESRAASGPAATNAHECSIRTKEGKSIIILKNSGYLKDKRGNVLGFIESFTDITERKRLEDDLRESRDYLKRIIDAVSDPIFVKDRQHRWVLLNNAYCAFMGYPAPELIGKTDKDFFPSKEASIFWAKDEEVFTTGKENINEEDFTSAGGVKHTISTKKSLYIDNDGNQYIVGIIRDITERKKVERLKDEFVSTVSHELRTPLSITKEGINLILDKIPGPINDSQAKVLNVSKSNIDRLARIINSLLDISKLESGKMKFRKEPFDILPVIRHAISTFEQRFKDKSVDLKENLPSKKTIVRGDTDAITEVMTNLLDNALKFTNSGGVEIAVKEKEDKIEVAVKDTGIGISEEDLPKLFEKFQQFARTTGPGEKGTGLGLAITKSIISAHGGDIWAKSALGKGTLITFTLPKEA